MLQTAIHPYGPGLDELEGYTDADFATSDPERRRVTSGLFRCDTIWSLREKYDGVVNGAVGNPCSGINN